MLLHEHLQCSLSIPYKYSCFHLTSTAVFPLQTWGCRNATILMKLNWRFPGCRRRHSVRVSVLLIVFPILRKGLCLIRDSSETRSPFRPTTDRKYKAAERKKKDKWPPYCKRVIEEECSLLLPEQVSHIRSERFMSDV